jgi:hypothetical protein
MSSFLEECKARFAAVQKAVQEAHQELQAVQLRYQTAIQQQNALQYLINSVAAEEQRSQQKSYGQPTTVNLSISVADAIAADEAAAPQPHEVNKTDMIRELLRRHPTGMTPTEIWREVKNQMTHRAYLYSILGRLKDREEVIVRRKKYLLRIDPKSVGEKEQAGTTVN